MTTTITTIITTSITVITSCVYMYIREAWAAPQDAKRPDRLDVAMCKETPASQLRPSAYTVLYSTLVYCVILNYNILYCTMIYNNML